MEKEEFLAVLTKYLDHRASPEEEHFLVTYYKIFLADPDVLALLEAKEKEKLKLSIKADIDAHIDAARVAPVRRLWPRIAAAASIILALSAGIWAIKHKTSTAPEQVATSKPILPGSNKAVLTLANGQKVSLTGAKSGQIASQNNTQINKTADGNIIYDAQANNSSEIQYNTVATDRGGQWPGLVLPDGTKIMLDAASSIKYPVAFNGKERIVEITGQVYFEVKHNASQPFKVKAGDQVIEDIGTAFNINAYGDEPYVSTTLVSGSIQINKNGQQALLTPGQQGLTSPTTQQIKVANVNVANVIAWKNGQTSFEGESIGEIMRQISRWYDVDIKYEGAISKRHFNGGISRKAELKDVLTILAFHNIHYKLENRTLTVKP